MKVVCIDENAWPDGYPLLDNNGIIRTGNEYNVIDVFMEDGYIWFEIEGDPKFGYWENAFSRISNINETELVNQKQQTY